jgi:hypothetical protein
MIAVVSNRSTSNEVFQTGEQYLAAIHAGRVDRVQGRATEFGVT